MDRGGGSCMYEDMKNSKNSQCNDVRDVTFCPPPFFFGRGCMLVWNFASVMRQTWESSVRYIHIHTWIAILSKILSFLQPSSLLCSQEIFSTLPMSVPKIKSHKSPLTSFFSRGCVVCNWELLWFPQSWKPNKRN